MRLLLVEDDPAIAHNLLALLRREHYAADQAGTLALSEEKVQAEAYDLAIVDRNLPDGDGLALIPRIRAEHPETLVLVLTAKVQNDDIVAGLDCGADDYVTKPFIPESLLARIRALLRRAKRVPIAPTLTVADLTIDTNTHQVARAGVAIDLSPREYAILEYLARHPCQTIDRMTIMTHVWDEEIDLFSNTVDVHIRYLRRKIDEHHKQRLIYTVRGKGYLLCDHSV